MIRVGEYHEYIGGCSAHQRVTMMHVGDIMIHVGGYLEHIELCSVHRGFQCKSKAFINLLSHMNHDAPRNVSL